MELVPPSQSTEDDPTLTADGLEMVFESTRAGTGAADLWWTSRTAIDQPFAAPVELSILNTTVDDEHPGLSPDGLTLYFGSNRAGGEGSYDIYTSTRSARLSTAWSAPVRDAELSDAMNNEAPQPADDLTIVLATGPNATNEDIFIATRASSASLWSTPVIVGAVDVNGGTTDSSPMLSGDRLALYFSSDRSNAVHHLYRAARPSLAEPFGACAEITELSATGSSDPWITPDEQVLVFSSGGRLYQATRQ